MVSKNNKDKIFIPEVSMSDTEIQMALIQHCGACHKSGSNRFIFEEKTANENVKWLRSTKSKLSNGSYAESIKSTISWPGDRVPKNTDRVDSKRRYMPFGAAKSTFNTAEIRGLLLREALLENL